jgi:hypothetical protein
VGLPAALTCCTAINFVAAPSTATIATIARQTCVPSNYTCKEAHQLLRLTYLSANLPIGVLLCVNIDISAVTVYEVN